MKDYYYKDLKTCVGADETTVLTLITDMRSGRSHIKLSKSVSQKFSTGKIDEAEDLFDKLTGGNGRRLYKPEDLL